MTKLFGIPVDTLLVVLVIALGVALGIVGLLALRHPVLVKLGVRNVGRRRGRTALIVVGVMLGTTIVATALTTGDTMSQSIRGTAVTAMALPLGLILQLLELAHADEHGGVPSHGAGHGGDGPHRRAPSQGQFLAETGHPAKPPDFIR